MAQVEVLFLNQCSFGSRFCAFQKSKLGHFTYGLIILVKEFETQYVKAQILYVKLPLPGSRKAQKLKPMSTQSHPIMRLIGILLVLCLSEIYFALDR